VEVSLPESSRSGEEGRALLTRVRFGLLETSKTPPERIVELDMLSKNDVEVTGDAKMLAEGICSAIDARRRCRRVNLQIG